MADPAGAKAVLDRFLERQREMYAGGDARPLEELLAEDVVWHVPGTSAIAGDHRGREAVMDYFRLRRALAGGAMSVVQRAEMHDDEVVVQLADGRAKLGGRDADWRTAGVYRVADGRIVEAWLVPLDQAHFDRVWAATRARPFVHLHRVRPEECDGSSVLGHPRLLELFQAAFIERCRTALGPLDGNLGPDRRVTMAAADVRYLAPAGVDQELRIEVTIDRATAGSLWAHYDAFVDQTHVASGGCRYVCVDAGAGAPAALLEEVAGL